MDASRKRGFWCIKKKQQYDAARKRETKAEVDNHLS